MLKVRFYRKTCKTVAVLLVLLLIAVLFLFVLSRWEENYGKVDISEIVAPDDGRVYLDDACYVPKDDLDVILLLGVDKFLSQSQDESYNNSQQTDFMMLLVMDRRNETCTALHLNRDTMAEIPVLGVRGEQAGTITGQLALAHTYGSGRLDSCRNAVKAVSDLLYGVKIDHFAAFTMDAVAQINDLAGGVTVTVLGDLSSVSPQMVEGTSLILTGDMALSYVRTRYGLEDSSNLRRMERQRQYLEGLRDQLSAKMKFDNSFLLDVLEKISPYMTSDCTINQLSQLYDHWELYADGGIRIIDGEAKVGAEYMEFYPDEAALKRLVVDLFYVPLEE